MPVVYYALVGTATVFFFLSLLEFIAVAFSDGRWRIASIRLLAGAACAGVAVLLLGRVLPVVDGLGGTALLFGAGAGLLVIVAVMAAMNAAWEAVAWCLAVAALLGLAVVGVTQVRDAFVQKDPLQVAVEFMRSGRAKFCLSDRDGGTPESPLLACQVARLGPAADSLSGMWFTSGVGQTVVPAENVFITDSPFLPPDVSIRETGLKERTDTSAVAFVSGSYRAKEMGSSLQLEAYVHFSVTMTLVSQGGVWFVRELTEVR
ncbi:MAG: hypothetical protein Q8N53_20380 [Longimicrobiales bacterium]|nr:hypothetical protein [Longimicrobiales bacterium]